MGDLKKWARDNNPNLRFESGESIVVLYRGHKVIPDAFNPGKEKIQYEFEIEGKVKYWSSGSGKVAEFFDKVTPGDFVKITATGEGMKRRYDLEESIDDSGTLTKNEAKKISEEMAG